jgi:hypothetical protein
MLARSHNLLMVVRIANLFVASFFVLCVIVPDSWSHGPTDPAAPGLFNPASVQPIPLTERSVFLMTLVFAWFFSAVFWFKRNSFSWLCSLTNLVAWIVFIGIVLFRL